MKPKSIRVFAFVACSIPATVLSIAAQTAAGSAASPAGKTTEQVYKNIQVLKGFASDQLIPAMQFITASLGVQCDFCHVENAFEKDDKDPKKSARKMIQMVLALNKDVFEGQQKVTCFACHRGARKPVIVPLIDEENKGAAEAIGPAQSNVQDLPNVDHILEKYLQAIGEAKGSANVTSRIQQGTLSVGPKSFSMEVLSEAPDKRLTTVQFADGDNVTAVSSNDGWSSSSGHPARDMASWELEGARLEAEMFFPSSLRTVFKEFKSLGTDKINGKEAVLVAGIRENSSQVHLYFEVESGLLVRMVRYTETPLGTNPTQIDYADYREQDGIKTPFRWSVSRPNRRFTVQIEKMRQSVPVDETKFLKPVAAPPR